MRVPSWVSGTSGGVVAALAGTAVLAAALAPFQADVGLLDEGLLFLLLTLIVSVTWGRNVGLFTAVITNMALNFFFVEPVHGLAVQDPRNVFALFVFLAVSIIGSSLLAGGRDAAGRAKRGQAHSEVTLSLSRALIGQTEPQSALEALCREAVRAFQAPGAAVLRRSSTGWSVLASSGGGAAGRVPTFEEGFLAEKGVGE